ncbi:MAG: DUF4159 domain-containing protein [Phycisphaerae bacterium]
MRRSACTMLVAVLLMGGVLASPAAAGPKYGTFTEENLDRAIKQAKDYLYSRQKNGHWKKYGKGPGDKNWHPLGPTALATVALLSAGENPQKKELKAALEILAKGAKSETGTYTLGLMGNVFMLANRKTQGKYRPELRLVTKRLVLSTKDGSYGYRSEGKQDSSGDHSNAQYGLLGVWGGRLGNEEIDKEYWAAVMRHWLLTQNADGGWAYKWDKSGKEGPAGPSGNSSTRTMVTAGVASLFVCFDNLFADAFVQCKTSSHFTAIQRGLDWFDRNFADDDGRIQIGSHSGYYLYGIERVGLASGYKYFGKADWFKLGTEYLLGKQKDNGSWGGGKSSVIETSYGLLFLARGRHPVLMNKLEFDGDWNNRPRDCAALTRYHNRTFEQQVAWQIINLKVPVREWHDAPILYISGAKAPNFSDVAPSPEIPSDIEKLRRYVLQGGTILSVTECDGKPFADGIRKTYAKLFPKYELTPVPKDHLLYSGKLQNDLRGRPKMYMVSNGIRPLAIHTDEDLSLHWQMERVSSRARAFEAMSNISAYVTDTFKMRTRGVSHWPEDIDAKPVATITVARVKHSGNYDPEPLAGQRLAGLMLKETGIKVNVTDPMDPTKLSAKTAEVAWITGVGQAKFSNDERSAIRSFVQAGGMVVIDAAGGSKAFQDSMKTELREMFDQPVLRIMSNDPLYNNKAFPLGDVKYRRKTVLRLGSERVKSPQLRGMKLDGRLAVVYSREDLTAGLVGYQGYEVDGYDPGTGSDPGTAYRLMRSILLQAAPEAAKKAAAAKTSDNK